MTDNVTPEVGAAVPNATGNNAEREQPAAATSRRNNMTRFLRNGVRNNTSSKEFDVASPKIGGVLGLRSENVTKKVSYDIFYKRLGIYIMIEFNHGENIIEVTKHPDTNVISDFPTDHQPHELTTEENKSSIGIEIKKEEIK